MIGKPQTDAVKWVSIAMGLLMTMLMVSVVLAGVLVGFTSLAESMLYASATIAPLVLLLFLALRKTNKAASKNLPK